MGQVCGGGGAKNACDSHPPLTGVDGYIVGAATQYSVSFALDGVTNSGGFCCETTPDGARAAYPGKNLVELPGQTQLAPDQIPPLRHVDGVSWCSRRRDGRHRRVLHGRRGHDAP